MQPRILKLMGEELAPSLGFSTLALNKGHGYLIGREGNGYQFIKRKTEKK